MTEPKNHASAVETPPPRRGLVLVLVVAVVLSALGAGALYWRHHHRLATEARRRNQEVGKGPRVFVAKIERSAATRELTLPADVRGFFQSTVYAKVSGYVKSIAVDKGDSVRRDQVLGVLESPEVDQQVHAAEADLVIKKRTYERYGHLVAKDFVSAQDYETARAAYDVARATLEQMRALQRYEILRAPFDGTVTARYVDPGALVPAAAGSTQSAQPLVDVADLRRLRITLFVQQDWAPFVSVGEQVRITVDERPELKITAPIARFAKALDPRSRTMLCEIWLDNERRLYPGTFVHVTLRLKTEAAAMAPSAALLIHDNQPSLATIREQKVHFVPVRTGLDDGQTVQILQGVDVGESVAVNLPAEIAEGALVQAEEQPKGQKQGGGEKGGGEKRGDGQQQGQGGQQQKRENPTQERLGGKADKKNEASKPTPKAGQ
ncbi:MAG TPA: efflux RND transporter periplasmic adaptor subunit [Polyangia bacterium]|nr:efflux RND transporter periplasmic adaptor subunit [Polyangia bacterium]